MELTTCSSCAAAIPDRYQRCGSCGTLRERAGAPAEIRRFATVVNSDLKGSTALGERLDPEALREVLTLYFDAMQAVFESHGGTIEKIIGDAIVAVFGLPVRHDDDAQRAVEAAAESQRALASLNDVLDHRWGVRLIARTGVATGEVVFGEASRGQHVLTGDTMKISSAMEQHAPPLEVLIAGSTYELVREMVSVEPADAVTPRGMSDAVPAYRLIAVDARPRAGLAAPDTAAAGHRLCPACGEENPEFFRLCGMCGAVLTAVGPVRESRKTVTLVFADPGPTSVDGRPPSPEALRDVMTRYFEAMKVALEQHGGTVEKFIGDAVMAVFGLPVRHEDDALRAVRAAAAMQAAIPALNDQFRAAWGLELRSHIGVNTGEVITGDASLGQRLVTGDAVNTAARLEQAAGPQEIILGELTYRLARDGIEVVPIPPLELKGKAKPVAAFRLVRVAQRPDERAIATTPFVGRESELARLGETVLEVSATRSCQLVLVIGDAGVGKSRLIREFAAQASARERTQVLRGRCLPYGDGVTFWPIAEIVRSAAGISDDDSPDVALSKIAEIALGATGQTDDPLGVADRVGAAIGLSTTQYPGPELFWGIRKLLEAIASRRPLVAIVDDIHAAAPTFLELLDHLLDAVEGAPILLLTTARQELLDARAEWAGAHKAAQLILEPLSADDAEAILDQLLGGLTASVRNRIIAAAEGNPLYVEQITSMLVETGAVRRDGNAWVATTTSGELEIPPTIQALVAARLDALHFEERQVIDPASVIGLGFPVDAVVQLVPEEAARDVPTHLQSLTAKRFVRPSVADDEVYRFGHSVIKDAAYRSLLKRTRAELHERFVEWAEPINRERGRELEFEEILGYHLEQAYRYRTELGVVNDDARAVGERAAIMLASAGRRALSRADIPAAVNLLGRAVDLLGRESPFRLELMVDLGEAHMQQGGFDAAAGVLDEAIAISEETGEERYLVRANLIRVAVDQFRSGSERGAARAIEAAYRAIAVLEPIGDAAGLARAWRLLMITHSAQGQLDQATEAAERVVEFAGLAGDTRIAARSAAMIAYLMLHGSMPADEAIRRCDELLENVAGDRATEALIQSARAILFAMQGAFETARSLYKQSYSVLTELGAGIATITSSIDSSQVERLAGDLDAASQELRRDYDALAAIDEAYFRSTVAAFLSQVLWSAGDGDGALRFSELAEELGDADDILTQVPWRGVRAKILASHGDAEGARRLAEEAVELAAGTSDLRLRADALLDLADVLAAIGKAESSGPPLREALSFYELKGDLVSAGRLRERIGAVVA